MKLGNLTFRFTSFNWIMLILSVLIGLSSPILGAGIFVVNLVSASDYRRKAVAIPAVIAVTFVLSGAWFLAAAAIVSTVLHLCREPKAAQVSLVLYALALFLSGGWLFAIVLLIWGYFAYGRTPVR